MSGPFALFKWEALFQEWQVFGEGFATTLSVSALGLLLALSLGITLGISSSSPNSVLRCLNRGYVEFIQNTPLLLQICFLYYALSFSGNSIGILLSGIVSIGIYHGGYISEVVRSGIQAVNSGQWEAAGALGLRRPLVLRLVVLPQALRVIIPPMTSQYLNLTKNSSLAVAIGYPDIVSVVNTTLNQTGQAIEGILIIMAAYLTVSLSISVFMNWYNKRIALVER